MNEFLCSVSSYEELRELYQAARKEGMIDDNRYGKSPVTLVKCVDETGKVIGMGKITRLSEKRARLGNLFVLPEYRGKGAGRALIEYRLSILEKGIKSVDTYTWHPEQYLELGFITVRHYKIARGETYYMVKKCS